LANGADHSEVRERRVADRAGRRRPRGIPGLVGALVLGALAGVTIGEPRPAAALPPTATTVDVAGLTLEFDYPDHTNITPSPGTDCVVSSDPCTGKTVGDVVRFNGVVTVGSTTVDAVVTTRPSAGPEATGVVNRYEVSSLFDEDGKFEFRLAGPTSTTAGMVGFLFEFYLAGTYTGPGTGVPVTLLNLGVVVDDIDPLQFFQFSAVDGYSVADPTDLVYNGANRRFSNPSGTLGTDDAQRAYVELSAASAVELWGGTEDGGSSLFQVTFGPATWTGSTTSTGPVVAESLAISAASSVLTIGWSSSPATDGATWGAAPACNAYATSDSSFATPLSGTLSPGVYVTHCTGGTPPSSFTISGYTDGELVVYAAPPTVTSVSPPSGPTAGGTTVTITGTGFVSVGGDTEVWIGGVPCTPVVLAGPTSLDCTTGARAAGTVDVLVRTYGTLTDTGAGLFTYVSSPSPTPPPPPTGVTLTAGPGPGRGTVSATAPASGPTPFAYQVRCMPPGTAQTSTAPPASWVHWPTLPVWVPLEPGYEYRCKVRARYGGPNNEGGGDWNEGPLSEWSNTVLIQGVPLAPTGVSVTAPGLPSGRDAAVAWSVTPGGVARPVVAQEARCVSSTGGVARSLTLAPEARRARLTALTQGASYVCGVRATNALGSSAWVDGPAFVVPQAAARTVKASAPVGRATRVSFVPAAGGLAVTEYRATCTSTDGGTTRVGAAPASPVTVANLTAGKQYRCTVTPRIGAANGATSVASNPITVP
jgi:hypothetical protein